MLLSWALSEPAKARARPPDPFPFWAAWSSTATAGCQPPGGQQGLLSRPPHSSSPAPSIPGSDCSSAPGRFRTVVPGSGVPPGPLPVRLSRVPPCDVRKACSQRSGRGSSLPLCPRARECSAPSRGAPKAPDFPFPNGSQTRGTGERSGLNLGSVAPKLQAAARGLGAHIRVELGGRQIWAPAGPKFEARAELGRERKSWRRLPLEAEHAPLQAAARARVFFFFFFNSKKRCIWKTTRKKKIKKPQLALS